MKKVLLILILILPISLFATIPPSIKGIEVSLIDASGKVIDKATFNSAGRLTLDGVTDAEYKIEVRNTKTNKSVTIGNKPADKIKVDKSTPLLMKVSLSDYQDGDDLVLRKRPGRVSGDKASGLATGKRGMSSDANHNTTRSNRTAALDPDSDNDGVDDDCDGIQVEISNKRGNKLELQARCSK